jgi:hypothetical protein
MPLKELRQEKSKKTKRRVGAIVMAFASFSGSHYEQLLKIFQT